MPKERSHVLIAEEIAGRIKIPSLRQLIDQKPALLYLGAVFPDILILPFSAGPGGASWSDILHDLPETGSSGMVHQMLVVLRADPHHQTEKLIFILGYLAHAAADISFHPLVCSRSGDYYDSDQEKRALNQAAHHSFETALDIALQGLAGKRKKERDLSFFSQLTTDEINMIFEFFAGVLSQISQSPKDRIMKYLKIDLPLFRLLDRLYHSRFFYYFARLVNFLSGKKIDKYFKLFYPPNYQSDLGAEEREEVTRIKEESVRLGAEWIEAAYLAWNTGSAETALPAAFAGKNMNSG